MPLTEAVVQIDVFHVHSVPVQGRLDPVLQEIIAQRSILLPRGSRECMVRTAQKFCSDLIGKVGRTSELQITYPQRIPLFSPGQLCAPSNLLAFPDT